MLLLLPLVLSKETTFSLLLHNYVPDISFQNQQILF